MSTGMWIISKSADRNLENFQKSSSLAGTTCSPFYKLCFAKRSKWDKLFRHNIISKTVYRRPKYKQMVHYVLHEVARALTQMSSLGKPGAIKM